MRKWKKDLNKKSNHYNWHIFKWPYSFDVNNFLPRILRQNLGSNSEWIKFCTKVKKDFDSETLPLMTSMINTICDEVPLKVDWKNFK